MSLRWLTLLLVLSAGLHAADEPASPASAEPAETPAAETPAVEAPAVSSVLETQVELHRRGFSCGAIDGVSGAQTAGALRAFQRSLGITESGVLDRATRERLRLTAPATMRYTIVPADLAAIRPVPETWLEKSKADVLSYGSVLELVAERHRASPAFLRRLNPAVDWTSVMPGQEVVVPAVQDADVPADAARQIVISLEARQLEVVDDASRVLAHFPVSIARMVEKRPVGELTVSVLIPDPDYTFDPAVFPESAEGRALGHKLVLPPGPNNPVGVAWIGLSRPGYGIHGTPDPEHVGRTESHGCFRLANWDVLTLMRLTHVGMRVTVVP